MQPDNEIWSVNSTSQEIFFFKNFAENEAEKLVPNHFFDSPQVSI